MWLRLFTRFGLRHLDEELLVFGLKLRLLLQLLCLEFALLLHLLLVSPLALSHLVVQLGERCPHFIQALGNLMQPVFWRLGLGLLRLKQLDLGLTCLR